MTYPDFVISLQQAAPPENVSTPVLAMWYDAKGDWEAAHNIAQEIHSVDGSWIHAYLHRKEGDLSNAAYWYSQAKRKMPVLMLESEWEEIARELISRY